MRYRQLGVEKSGVNEDSETVPHRDILDLILGPTSQQKEVRAIAVSSINGSTSLDGVSGGLGNPLDFKLLMHLRAWADVVVAGSGTILQEEYGGVKLDEFYRTSRLARGQEATPPIGILSTSLPFTPKSKIFVDTVVPPLIITPPASADKADKLEHVCQGVIYCDTSDPAQIVHSLQDRGYSRILLEGGPTTLRNFFLQDMVDVFHHTIDPSIVTPTFHTLVPSPTSADNCTENQKQAQISFLTDNVVVTDDGVVFVRYVRS